MLNYEFIQESEFTDPYYDVMNDDLKMAEIIFDEEWRAIFIEEFSYSADALEQIVATIDELNDETNKQLIFGVF